jgi:hypothetical protein
MFGHAGKDQISCEGQLNFTLLILTHDACSTHNLVYYAAQYFYLQPITVVSVKLPTFVVMYGILSSSKNCRKFIVTAFKSLNLIHHTASDINEYEVLGQESHILTMHDYILVSKNDVLYNFCGYIGSTCYFKFKSKGSVIRNCRSIDKISLLVVDDNVCDAI